jgi:hypothetical protein
MREAHTLVLSTFVSRPSCPHVAWMVARLDDSNPRGHRDRDRCDCDASAPDEARMETMFSKPDTLRLAQLGERLIT